MTKEEFIENYLFEKYKNTPFKNGDYFREILKDETNINLDNLYKRIVNYQVRKYGYSLSDKNLLLSKERQQALKSRNKYMNSKLIEKDWSFK